MARKLSFVLTILVAAAVGLASPAVEGGRLITSERAAAGLFRERREPTRSNCMFNYWGRYEKPYFDVTLELHYSEGWKGACKTQFVRSIIAYCEETMGWIHQWVFRKGDNEDGKCTLNFMVYDLGGVVPALRCALGGRDVRMPRCV